MYRLMLHMIFHMRDRNCRSLQFFLFHSRENRDRSSCFLCTSFILHLRLLRTGLLYYGSPTGEALLVPFTSAASQLSYTKPASVTANETVSSSDLTTR